MELGLKGKVALVTGASRGIGRAIATGLAEEGCRLAICARGKDALEEAAADMRSRGAEVLAVSADMTQAGDVETVIREALAAYGTIGILANNAGGSRGGQDPSDGDWHYTLDLNLLAAIRTCRLAVPEMRKAGWGRIINIASIWGRESGGGMTYNAAKASVISFSKALSTQVAPYGITVNSLCPGSILFPGGGWARRVEQDPDGMARFVKDSIPGGRFGRLDEVASVAVFLASERASWITGAAITVDGGQSKSNI